MEAGVPLGEFWAVGKTGQGHVPALAFPLPRPQDVSPCACSLSGPGFGRKVQRPRFLPAPGRMLLPLQACPARGPISAQRFPTRHAERASQTNQRRKPTNVPSRSDQRSRKAAQSGLAFLFSDGKASAYNVGDLGSTPGLGRFPGEGNGNPLQYSCLENPMDRGAW